MDKQVIRKVVVPVCPGCGKEIWGRLSVDVDTIDDKDPDNLIMHGTVTGMEVSHNCMPTATRGRGGGM